VLACEPCGSMAACVCAQALRGSLISKKAWPPRPTLLNFPNLNPMQVAVIGVPNAGKSTLTNMLVGQKVGGRSAPQCGTAPVHVRAGWPHAQGLSEASADRARADMQRCLFTGCLAPGLHTSSMHTTALHSVRIPERVACRLCALLCHLCHSHVIEKRNRALPTRAERARAGERGVAAHQHDAGLAPGRVHGGRRAGRAV